MAALDDVFDRGLDGVSEAEVRKQLNLIETHLAGLAKSTKLYAHVHADVLKLKYYHQRYSNYVAMADASEIITGSARDWLAAKRAELNGRFRLAQRRFSQLNAESVLALCRELLPPLAGIGENGSADLLAAVYDLILLHAGRGTLAPGGGSSPGIGELLRTTFPRLRRCCWPGRRTCLRPCRTRWRIWALGGLNSRMV